MYFVFRICLKSVYEMQKVCSQYHHSRGEEGRPHCRRGRRASVNGLHDVEAECEEGRPFVFDLDACSEGAVVFRTFAIGFLALVFPHYIDVSGYDYYMSVRSL